MANINDEIKNPLDETMWFGPQFIAQWGPLHENSILHYFAQSSFFDPTSNNAILTTQATYNQDLLQHIGTLAAMEARLKTMSGLEFVVLQAPAVTAPGLGTGVWVIGKQNRRKRHGEEDEITLQQVYYVIGNNIFMAPSIAAVMNSRLLAALSGMSKFITTAEALPNFSPAIGHTYLPPTSNRPKPTDSQPGQMSKENTPMPDSLAAQKSGTTSSANPHLSHRLLDESLRISARYDDEYMDEYPITGQPGDFHLSTKSRVEASRLAVPPIMKGPLTAVAKSAALPSPLTTDIPPARKDSKSGKSPKTPGTAGGAPKLKRRKSKAPTGGLASPTT